MKPDATRRYKFNSLGRMQQSHFQLQIVPISRHRFADTNPEPVALLGLSSCGCNLEQNRTLITFFD
jgi:hypothetical protein